MLGWIASAVFLTRLVPQPTRLLRTGVPDGVSPMSAMNTAVTDLGWLAYGLQVALVPVWAVAAVSLFPCVLMVVLLARRTTRRDMAGSALWLLVVLVATALGALGAVLSISVVVTNGPQVWVALREHHLDGISPATWFLAVADASLWGAYGVATGDGALMGYGSVLVASSLVILTRIWWTRRANSAMPAGAPAVETVATETA